MAIEVHEDGGITITGSDIMDVYRPLTLKGAIKIEVVTGMTNSRGSVMKVINREYGQNFRRKKDALKFMETLCDKLKAERQ